MSARSSLPAPRPGRRPGRGPAWGWAALILAGVALLTGTGPAAAHGVEAQAGSGPAAWVRAEYSDGEPMSYAKVRILDPQGQTFQVGNADGRGCFAWLPATAGPYRAVMDDGQGHRAEVSLDWSPGAKAEAPAAGQDGASGLRGQSPWARAAWGLSFLFWLGGAWFWWKGRAVAASRR